MRKLKNRNTRLGLFLSIELVVIMVIVTVIIVAVALGADKLLSLYKAQVIAANVTRLGESIISFRNTYEYYPGDLPSVNMSGELNVSEAYKSVTNMETITFSSGNGFSFATGTSTTFTTEDVEYYFRMATNYVGSFKMIRAAQQLKLSGLAIKGLTYVSTTTEFSGGAQGTFAATPIKDADGLIYIYKLDACDQGTPCADWIIPMLYSPRYGAYPATWSNKPRIFVTASQNMSDPGTSNAVPNSKSSSPGIPPELAAIIDSKMDDGLPLGIASKVIAGDSIDDAGTTWSNGSYSSPGIFSKINATNSANIGCTTLFYTSGSNANSNLKDNATSQTINPASGSINLNDISRESIVGNNETQVSPAQYRKNAGQKFAVSDKSSCYMGFLVSGT